MKAQRSYMTWSGNKITEEMTPEESSDLSREGMEAEYPDYRKDPSYHWAREAKRKKGRR
jgi:hypothetical protein